jgi:hypothetical protein
MVSDRPQADSDVIENVIVWATAVRPKADLWSQWRVGCQHLLTTVTPVRQVLAWISSSNFWSGARLS